jgi:methyl coenzyme M reductase alpha subunit
MADFSDLTKINSVYRAANLLDRVRGAYAAAKAVSTELTAYQAGTDVAYNAAVNALFSAAQRAELSAVAAQLATLVADWELNHASLVGSGGS